MSYNLILKGDYEDGRFNTPADGLTANLGRMPVMNVGDETIGQSLSIYYYIASENGLMGSSVLEAAKILSIFEHLKEMLASFRTLVPYGEEPTDEAANTWFESGSMDVLGTADSLKRDTRYLHWYMGRIEQTLGTEGFAGAYYSFFCT